MRNIYIFFFYSPSNSEIISAGTSEFGETANISHTCRRFYNIGELIFVKRPYNAFLSSIHSFTYMLLRVKGSTINRAEDKKTIDVFAEYGIISS